MFAFLGDTTSEVFARHPEVLEMPVVVTECSFFGAEHLANAERTRHTHWDRLRPIVADHPETTFVLGHFSWRYDAQQVFAQLAASGLTNIVPWIEDASGLRYTMGV
jgi:ribonuclease Z